MTYFMYGSHRHPDNEVQLTQMEVLPRYSERGARTEIIYRLHLSGELIYTGTELLEKIQELILAYEENNRDAVLYMDDGTATTHQIRQNHPDNISGVTILQRSWPRGESDELATVRTFGIVLEAIYRAPELQLTEYSETVTSIGRNPNPYWVMVPVVKGLWRRRDVAENGIQRVVQSGVVVGYDGWPITRIPPPVAPTEFEQYWLRRFEPLSPQFRGRLFTHYPIRYSYTFVLPSAGEYFPRIQ